LLDEESQSNAIMFGCKQNGDFTRNVAGSSFPDSPYRLRLAPVARAWHLNSLLERAKGSPVRYKAWDAVGRDRIVPARRRHGSPVDALS
jgi:hypothetical protein